MSEIWYFTIFRYVEFIEILGWTFRTLKKKIWPVSTLAFVGILAVWQESCTEAFELACIYILENHLSIHVQFIGTPHVSYIIKLCSPMRELYWSISTGLREKLIYCAKLLLSSDILRAYNLRLIPSRMIPVCHVMHLFERFRLC